MILTATHDCFVHEIALLWELESIACGYFGKLKRSNYVLVSVRVTMC